MTKLPTSRREPRRHRAAAARGAAVAVLAGKCLLIAAFAVAAPPGDEQVIVQPPPVPPQFGFYGTRWRRWNAADTMPAKPGEAATPVSPARSVVPGAQEEALADPRNAQAARPQDGGAMPLRPQPPAADPAVDLPADPAAPQDDRKPPAEQKLEPLPPPGDGRKPARPGAAGLPQDQKRATRQFLARLSSDAAAAAAGSRAQQAEFTQRLVGELLAAHDPEDRKAIVETVAAFDTPAAAAICTGALDDPSPIVRMAACTACASRGGPDAIPQLARKSAGDPDLGVRLRAIKALGDSRAPAAVTALAAVVDDPDPAVRGRVIEALKRSSGQNLGDDPEAWRRWAAGPRTPATRWSMSDAIRKLF